MSSHVTVCGFNCNDKRSHCCILRDVGDIPPRWDCENWLVVIRTSNIDPDCDLFVVRCVANDKLVDSLLEQGSPFNIG